MDLPHPENIISTRYPDTYGSGCPRTRHIDQYSNHRCEKSQDWPVPVLVLWPPWGLRPDQAKAAACQTEICAETCERRDLLIWHFQLRKPPWDFSGHSSRLTNQTRGMESGPIKWSLPNRPVPLPPHIHCGFHVRLVIWRHFISFLCVQKMWCKTWTVYI